MKPFSLTEKRLWGLKAKELTILNHIPSRHPVTASWLAEKCHFPRTTIAYKLASLKKRGLVLDQKKARERYWQLTDLRQLSLSAEASSKRLAEGAGLEIGGLVGSSRINVLHGKHQVTWLSEQMLKAGSERVYLIQSVESIGASLRAVEEDFIVKHQTDLRSKGVILEGLIPSKALGLFDQLTDKQLQAHLDRRIVAYVVPEGYLELGLDVFVIGPQVIMADFKQDLMFVIDHQSVAETFRQLITVARDFASRVDLNAYLRELLEKRKAI